MGKEGELALRIRNNFGIYGRVLLFVVDHSSALIRKHKIFSPPIDLIADDTSIANLSKSEASIVLILKLYR